MKKTKIFTRSIGILFLIILMAELYLRIFKEKRVEYGYPVPVMQKASKVGFKFIPNLRFKTSDGVVKFNKYGYLGTNWKKIKDKDKYRIAVVGACNPTGVFHIEDNIKYNYPELSNNELLKRGYNVEILNFSVPGENRSYYQFKTIELEVVDFNPDLVLLEFNLPLKRQEYIRDNYDGYQIEYLPDSNFSKKRVRDWVNRLNKNKISVFLINNFKVFGALAKKYQHTHKDEISTFIKFADKKQVSFVNEAVSGYYSIEKSIEMIESMAKTLEAKNIDFRFLFYHPVNKEVVERLNDYDLKILSLNTKLTKELFYPNDDHFNNMGQLHLKDKFVEELKKIIPNKYIIK